MGSSAVVSRYVPARYASCAAATRGSQCMRWGRPNAVDHGGFARNHHNIYAGAIARAYLPSREQHAFTRGDASTEEEAAAKRRAKIAE